MFFFNVFYILFLDFIEKRYATLIEEYFKYYLSKNLEFYFRFFNHEVGNKVSLI